MGEYYKMSCPRCSGHIEFPAEAAGQTLPCPHCERHTRLMAPVKSAEVTPEEERLFEKIKAMAQVEDDPLERAKKKLAIVAIILFLLLIVMVAAAALLPHMKGWFPAYQPKPSGQQQR